MHLLLVDTIGGQNSSLQVHPTACYNQDVMNYPYGHHEGYYIINATSESAVHLGVKEKYGLDEFTESLREAQKTQEYDAKEYVGYFPVKEHDFIYLPGGVVHAFCMETVCLEIDSFSTTTFKLWDWGRLDDSGKPRQIDIDLGERVIQKKFTAEWCRENLFFRESDMSGTRGEKMKIGTMDYCPMSVNKYWLSDEKLFITTEQLQIIVLVEGNAAKVTSPDNRFEDYEIHYMEALYIPANLKNFVIKPIGGSEIAIVTIEKETN